MDQIFGVSPIFRKPQKTCATSRHLLLDGAWVDRWNAKTICSRAHIVPKPCCPSVFQYFPGMIHNEGIVSKMGENMDVNN